MRNCEKLLHSLYDEICDDDSFLSHDGIKGMKWGVVRWREWQKERQKAQRAKNKERRMADARDPKKREKALRRHKYTASELKLIDKLMETEKNLKSSQTEILKTDKQLLKEQKRLNRINNRKMKAIRNPNKMAKALRKNDFTKEEFAEFKERIDVEKKIEELFKTRADRQKRQADIIDGYIKSIGGIAAGGGKGLREIAKMLEAEEKRSKKKAPNKPQPNMSNAVSVADMFVDEEDE